MKLIAKAGFRNNIEPPLEIDKAKNKDHVHKGAIFEYGRGATLKECSQAEQRIIGQLALAGCIADATDSKIVKRIQDEVAQEAKTEKNIAEQNAGMAGK
jgi:hypothetical protein